MKQLTLILLTIAAATMAPALANDVTLVANSATKVCVVVADGALKVNSAAANADQELVLLRWAAEDLTNYLARISGAAVPLGATPASGLVPIYVGNAPEKLPLTAKSEFGDAHLLDVNDQRIVLQGESARAVHYAASMLLGQLGVRWYGPTELGECVPQRATLALAAGRTESAPQFQTRGLWADKRWAVRNRLGGPVNAQGHGFYGLMDGYKNFEQHPEYYPIVNGKPSKGQVNLSSDGVADLFAKTIAEGWRKGPNHWAGGLGACVGPDDGFLPNDERPETRALANGETDPFLQVPSMTDPFIHLCNAVADRLEKEFPNQTLGFYVYSNHNLPPTKFKPHRMLFPVITPITYTRFGSIGNPNVPTSMFLVDVIKAWRAFCPRLDSYLYNFNLADAAMPFSRRLYFTKTMPKLYELGVHYSTVESFQDAWQHNIPASWVYSRVAWDTTVDVTKLLDEFYPLFYGPAAEAMRKYHTLVEDAYENTGAYAGNIWSMHRLFPPETVKEMAALLTKAEKQVQGQALYEPRVEVIRIAYRALECWLSARQALNEGKLAEAAQWNESFKANWESGNKKYPLFVGKYAWAYYQGAHYPAFADAGRLAKEATILYRFPDSWKGRLDKDKIGIKDAWFTPTADVSGWGTLRTYGVSLDELGYPFYRGLIWYRHDFELPKTARKATTLRLWIGGVDDTAHVYVNGTLIGTYPGKYFSPVDVDITAAAKRDGRNVIVVAVDNTGINELGTGGITRPVFLYEPKTAATGSGAGKQKKGYQPLFGGGQ